MSLYSSADSALWSVIVTEIGARRPLVCATVVRDSGSVPRRSGSKMLVHPDGRIQGSVGGGLFESLVVNDALDALKKGQSVTKGYSFNPKGTSPQAFGAICGGRVEVFLEVIMPPERLIVVGGGHCGRALVRMASLLDFDIVVADDREEYSRSEDFAFPNVSQVLHLPATYEGLPLPDESTFVALVSKGFITDEAALRQVLNAPSAYIGMMGSVRKREVVFDNLRKDGVSEERLVAIHAPIGEEIGAETPEEIAVSILAEIIRVRSLRRKQTAPVETE